MFTVKRLHKLTDYKESSPESLSMLNMLPPFPTKFSHLVGVIFWLLFGTNFTGWYLFRSNVSVK